MPIYGRTVAAQNPKKTRNKRTRAKLRRDLKKQKIYVQPLSLWPKSLTPDEITLQIFQQADRQLEALLKHYKFHSRGRPRKWKNTERGDIASKQINEKVDKRR